MATFLTIAHALGILTALHAVMHARTSQGSFAWAIGLVGFPVLAVPLYWVFGRSKFHGYALAYRQDNEDVRRKLAEFYAALDAHRTVLDGDQKRFEVVQALARAPFTDHNRAELLVDGDATFKSIFQGIESAEKYIVVEYYIIHDDDIGKELKRRLIAKAKEGVDVRLTFDGLGSHSLPQEYVEELRSGGVAVRPFNTTAGTRNRFQLNFRNHRKIVVVDGRLAFIGGLNVGDEYLGKGPLGPWRDTHLRLEGPAVLTIQLAWAQDWHFAGGNATGLDWTPDSAADGDMTAAVVAMGPADPIETYNSFAVNAINVARERIWIASPYFVPDAPAIRALQLAAMRGVDVRVIIPETADSRIVQLAAFAFFERLADTGVKFFFHGPGFMHQKVVLVDDDFASVGTANFDNRSFRLNFEIIAAVADRGFAADVERMLEKDLESTRPIKPEEYSGRSFWFRLQVRVAYLVSQVM